MKSIFEMRPFRRWALRLLKRARLLPYLVPAWQSDKGVEADRHLKTYEECYAALGIVFAGVSAIAQAGAMVPMIWYKIPPGKTENEKEPLSYQHPLCQLFRAINPIDTAYDLHEELWSYKILTGNYYLCGEPSDADQPTELWGMRPSRVRIKVAKTEDAKKFIEGYTYTNDLGRAVTFPAKDVLHLKLFNPTDPFYGQGCIAPILEDLFFDIDMLKYNRNLIKNLGVPYGGWETDMLLEATEVERLKAELKTQFEGPKKAGSWSFTHGGLKWKDHGMHPRDLQWPQARKDVRGRALQGMGVPPVLAGMSEDVNTFATALIQERIFWRITVIPKQTKNAATFTQWAQSRWGSDIIAAYDYSNVEALREDEERKAKIFQIGFQCGAVRPDDMRQSVYHLEPIGGDAAKLWAPMGMMPVEGTEAKAPRSRDGRAARKRLIDSEERAATWRKFAEALVPWEKKWVTAMREYFTALEAKVLKAFEDRARAGEWEIVEGVLDDPAEVETLRTVGKPLTSGTVDEFGRKALVALNLDMDFSVTNPEVKKWIEAKTLKFAREVNDTTKDLLKEALAKAADKGATITEITKEIERIMGIRRGAAENIARTETISAANAGEREAWRQSGVVEKREWLSSRDSLVRDSHADMDGEVVAFDEPYSNGLMFPGDPVGDPSEICNCRCTELAVVNEKALKELQHRYVMNRIERQVYPGREGSKRCLQK